LATKELSENQLKQLYFFHPDEFVRVLRGFVPKTPPTETVIKGYRVRVNYTNVSQEEQDEAQKSIAKTVLESLKKKKGK